MFIVFEGVDGSGKTTQSLALYEKLRDKGYRVSWSKEPTDCLEELTLANFMEDRKQHVLYTIGPNLADDYIVIVDRYVPSTLVYQTNERSIQKLWAMNSAYPKPDITFWLDVDVATAEGRVAKRDGEGFQDLGLFIEKYKIVMEYVGKMGYRCVRINGEGEMSAIAKEVWSHLGGIYGEF